ncbi:hypothetical protein [Cellulomonas shaoxiangyii]|uniref:Uncharacterized protein n=1 Tax=Cellulomonas shaoxiangyii TaxID=2566013 RepID=A0A4P7SKN6_9CELL|nr:hypothetical protein [Cellulomonas shaoxiangyii]QCB93314.1 hypothetical protein E5225_06880 [Cellulomonas shaoxiangyii]TGY79419.1 hypothetical protein E5226_15410 [Cellulomonas shaoxiangyii]
MSEQPTPRTVEDAARAYVTRRHPPLNDRGVGIAQGSHYRDGFVAGASWQAARMPSEDEVAEVLAAHVACYGGSDDAYAVTCSCDRYGRPMGYGREGATVHARHQAERVAALYGTGQEGR